MKNIIVGGLLTVVIFLLSVGLLFDLNSTVLNNALKITIISMMVTFILATARSLIDKIGQIVHYLVMLSSEEQRGIPSSIGIDIEKPDISEIGKIDIQDK
ncbi:MAG: hypothetical protein LBM03_01575 [Erysipelotrichaceae bacterium]|jgi:hypothetical protein|nr:hypothetical protein [Erysipelotrichaceae bacterium]